MDKKRWFVFCAGQLLLEKRADGSLSVPLAAQPPVPLEAWHRPHRLPQLDGVPCVAVGIDAPVVGTFYVAPAPDQPPFVQPGDKVQKGQTVCLMEAMKMMSEVKAPCDCVIEAVLQEDGALVSFGDALIRYREG